jgi:hypothetical protein
MFKIDPGFEDVSVMHCHGTADPVVSNPYILILTSLSLPPNPYILILTSLSLHPNPYLTMVLKMLLSCNGTADPVVKYE